MKVWRGNEATDDKLIAIDGSKIYKGNPKTEEIESCITGLANGTVLKQGFTCIPVRYLQEISMQEGKNCIQLIMGKDSGEDLRIQDEKTRVEIFTYFKNHIPGGVFKKEQYSKLKAGQKPLIALAVVTGLFLWTLPYAIGSDNGAQYGIVNDRYDSLTGIVLALASLGKTKVFLIFGGLAAIALFSFYQKAKHPPTISRIKFR